MGKTGLSSTLGSHCSFCGMWVNSPRKAGSIAQAGRGARYGWKCAACASLEEDDGLGGVLVCGGALASPREAFPGRIRGWMPVASNLRQRPHSPRYFELSQGASANICLHRWRTHVLKRFLSCAQYSRRAARACKARCPMFTCTMPSNGAPNRSDQRT